jgi:hypothetical protein
MRVLHLIIQRKWFDQIASGDKRHEFREAKPYWARRLEGKAFDQVQFRCGYASSAPSMLVECRGISKGTWLGRPAYIIALGQVLETKNYPGAG